LRAAVFVALALTVIRMPFVSAVWPLFDVTE
jgi:hypothetical protein